MDPPPHDGGTVEMQSLVAASGDGESSNGSNTTTTNSSSGDPRRSRDPDEQQTTGRIGAGRGASNRRSSRRIGNPASASLDAIAGADASSRRRTWLALFIILGIAMSAMMLLKKDATGLERGVEGGETSVRDVLDGDDDDFGAEKKSAHVGTEPDDGKGYEVSSYLYPSFPLPNAPPTFSRGTGIGGGYDQPIKSHFQYNEPNSKLAADDPTSDAAKDNTASLWGYFDFEDPDAKWRGKLRPSPDFESVVHRDVKGEDFPEGSWQSDGEYVSRFLEEGKKLVNRTMEAIYAEYGVGLPPNAPPNTKLTDEQLVQRESFSPFTINDGPYKKGPGGHQWTMQKSFDGLSRRLIHAIMTGDTFRMVLGGHSAAQGVSVAFNQSYFLQAERVLDPVFAHLGVSMRAHNLAMGGLGTLQQAMTGMDVRGKDTDFIMWDSHMTERSQDFFAFFMKSALLAGDRAPFLFGDGMDMSAFYNVAGADVGEHGAGGWNGPVTTDAEQALTVPFSARYLNCAGDAADLCRDWEIETGCWVDREDVTPPTGQVGYRHSPRAQSWHPGNRVHKVRGRRIAMFVLRGLQYALEQWEELTKEGGHPLADEHWHVGEHYKNIKEKAVVVPGCWGPTQFKMGQTRRARGLQDDSAAAAGDVVQHQLHRELEEPQGTEGHWPSRICNVPLQGRSNYGPRVNPLESSLMSILRPNAKGDIDPNPDPPYLVEPFYSPPDLPSQWDDAEVPEVNPLRVASARRRLDDEDGGVHDHGVQQQHRRSLEKSSSSSESDWVTFQRKRDAFLASTKQRATNSTTARRLLEDPNAIVPGYGIFNDIGGAGFCDGSTHHWCNKVESNGCLMMGQQAHRGSVMVDGTSGWVVFDITNVKHGFIGARLEPWRGANILPLTRGWTEVNNGGHGNYEDSPENATRRALQVADDTQRLREQFKQQMEEDVRNEYRQGDDPDYGSRKSRRLGGGQSCGLSGDYIFEFAINGNITTWTKNQFCEHFTRLAYNLDVVKFMDDESLTGDFELAMRIVDTPSGTTGMMGVTHLYWA